MKASLRRADREIGIERHASFFVSWNRSIAFDREQRAELLVRQLGNGFGQIMDRLALLARERKDGMASELGQTAAQLRLKNYDQRNREENRETANEPAYHDQIQQRRDEGKSQKNNRQTGQDFGPARAAKVKKP